MPLVTTVFFAFFCLVFGRLPGRSRLEGGGNHIPHGSPLLVRFLVLSSGAAFPVQFVPDKRLLIVCLLVELPRNVFPPMIDRSYASAAVWCATPLRTMVAASGSVSWQLATSNRHTLFSADDSCVTFLATSAPTQPHVMPHQPPTTIVCNYHSGPLNLDLDQ